MIIDTHIHLDDERFIDDFDDVIKRANENDIYKFIIPGTSKDYIKRAKQLSNNYDGIYYAVGIHPNYASSYEDGYLDTYLKDKKFVAIGECGLDYFHTKDENEIKKQKEVFIEHIKKANELDMPLIVHVRDSSEDAKEILMKYSKSGGVLHCFNGDDCLIELKDIGFYFGIGGVVTFKNAKKLQETCLKLPYDKILLETDAPYLSPAPNRGKRNESANLVHIIKKLSEILSVSYEDIINISLDNSKKLFKKLLL
jgi:TatD DNase family protein